MTFDWLEFWRHFFQEWWNEHMRFGAPDASNYFQIWLVRVLKRSLRGRYPESPSFFLILPIPCPFRRLLRRLIKRELYSFKFAALRDYVTVNVHLLAWFTRATRMPGVEGFKKCLHGEAPPQGPIHYPFINHFSRKRHPFRIPRPSIDKWYAFHIPCLELCIPFNCCKCTVCS